MRENYKFTDEEWELFEAGIEIWRDVPGWEGMYQVSTFGRVKTMERMIKSNCNNFRISEERIKEVELRKDGYTATLFCRNSKVTQYKIHRLVGIAFMPNPENKRDINHISGVRSENRLENLEWATRSENKLHGFRIGMTKPTCLGIFGKDHHLSKPVLKIDIETGNIIERYDGLMDASRKTCLGFREISACARGKRQSYNNYLWQYEVDYNQKMINNGRS